MVFISLKVYFIVFFEILRFSLRIFIEVICVVALVLAIMTMRGFTFHSLFIRLLISG